MKNSEQIAGVDEEEEEEGEGEGEFHFSSFLLSSTWISFVQKRKTLNKLQVWMKTKKKKKKNAKLFCRQAALILSLLRHLRRWSMYQRFQVYLNFPPQKA
jgi:hypothetical protein